MQHVYYLLVISAFVCMPGARSDPSANLQFSDHAFHLAKEGKMPLDYIKGASLKEEVCNETNPCENDGTCYDTECWCPREFTGPRCETPTWCSWGRCGFGSDVKCVWDRKRKQGECRCTTKNYHYLPKERRCLECDCGSHGSCQVAGDVLVCKCDPKYALKAGKCAPCDCGPKGERCSFNSDGEKVCQCAKDYASKTVGGFSYGTRCEICDCEHGKCTWVGEEKICDCEEGYKSYEGKCRECDCGRFGSCRIDEFGERVCSCDYGYAENEGRCVECDCNFLTRSVGVNCTFVDGFKQCICPPGFETGEDYCEDINECYTSRPCPAHALCINKPGTFECKCEPGFKPVYSYQGLKLTQCEDIDECLDSPCLSAATRCVNSPGSFDCVCKDGFYATAATYGLFYKPAYNYCSEIETQWREATIALGVILSIAIIGISCYIMIHKSR